MSRSRRATNRRAALRAFAVAALAMAPLVGVRRASAADDAVPTSVGFAAPPECPGVDAFAAQLHARTGKFARSEDPSVEGRVEVTVRQGSGGRAYVGRVHVRIGGSTTDRELRAGRCETLVAALALTTAIVLDPEGARTDAVVVPSASASAAPPPSMASASASAPPPPVPSPPPSSPPPRPSPFTAQRESAWRFTASLAGGGSTAVNGVAGWGELAFEARSTGAPGLGGRLALFGATPGSASSSAGTVAYQAYGARLDGCPIPAAIGRVARVDPCASFAAWLVPVNAPSASVSTPSVRTLLAPGTTLRLEMLTGSLRPGVEAGAYVHLLDESFRIDPGGRVFRLPAAYTTVALYAAWTIP